MIEIYTDQLADSEILHAVPAGQKKRALPTVIFYHGFTSSKLVYSYFAVALAQAGMRVIMPDAQEHGARFSGDETFRQRHFWTILKTSIDEFPTLHQALTEKNLIIDERLAVAGASMGGMTALGIMARQPEVKCVASLMGSGYYLSLAERLFPPVEVHTPQDKVQLDRLIAPLESYDISSRLERVGDRPLLLWHGEEDDVVPAAETWRLEQALKARQLDSHLTCLWEAGVRHRITPAALEATSHFFSQHL